jgi:hypothetical protein
VEEDVGVPDCIGSFKEPGDDDFKEDGGGRGIETEGGDDFKEDVVGAVEVAADLEYVEEEEGVGFKE